MTCKVTGVVATRVRHAATTFYERVLDRTVKSCSDALRIWCRSSEKKNLTRAPPFFEGILEYYCSSTLSAPLLMELWLEFLEPGG